MSWSQSGGSPAPSLQALAVALFDAAIEGAFLLTFERVLRALNRNERASTTYRTPPA